MLNIWLTLIVIIFIVYILRLVAKKVVELKCHFLAHSLFAIVARSFGFPNFDWTGFIKMLGIQVPNNLIFS